MGSTPSLGTDAMAISRTDSTTLSESCAASITVGWEILTSEALTLEDILFIYGPATVAVSNLDARGREIEALDRYK